METQLSRRDRWGTIGARTGFARNNYAITPGLYAVGRPDKVQPTPGTLIPNASNSEGAPILVTGNYKLTFDSLRRELDGIDCWLLVVDTRGINVWCAGGKGSFCAEEIAYQVQRTELAKLVSHRRLILPQLSANGVAARKLKSLCGFRGEFGPVRAAEIPAYLQSNHSGTIDESMRSASFTLRERAELIPLELCMLWKKLIIAPLIFVLLSLIGPLPPDGHDLLVRIGLLLGGGFIAVLSGSALVPLLLPVLRVPQFWVKGALVGLGTALLYVSYCAGDRGLLEKLSLLLTMSACSAFMAMNFTGSTPFTSLSGVSKEMRQGLPVQIVATAVGLLLWIVQPFIN